MTIATQSVFHYGLEIDGDNTFFEIQTESGANLTFQIPEGSCCHSDMPMLLNKLLEAGGTGFEELIEFVLDRELCRIIVRSKDGSNFSILSNTGPNAANGAYETLGFSTDQDYTGSNEYMAEKGLGKKYYPQFYLQDFDTCDVNRELRQATVNESSTGKCEVLFCGIDTYFEFEIKYISNCPSSCRSYRTDPMGVEKAVDFLTWALCRKCIEFTPDCNRPENYFEIKIDRIPGSRNATRFKLRDMFEDIGCEKIYYKTGKLRWRVVNKNLDQGW